MSKKLMMLAITLVAFGCLATAAPKAPKATKGQRSFTGVVSDEHCGTKHAMASEDAATCVGKCVKDGAKYVLVSRGKVYQVEPQDKFADFAGKRAKVTGTKSGDTITASSVQAAASHAKRMRKSKKAEQTASK